ncbi:MAG: hypothetical protein ACREOD_03205 [Candidatus Dormibacteria bacterium]
MDFVTVLALICIGLSVGLIVLAVTVIRVRRQLHETVSAAELNSRLARYDQTATRPVPPDPWSDALEVVARTVPTKDPDDP